MQSQVETVSIETPAAILSGPVELTPAEYLEIEFETDYADVLFFEHFRQQYPELAD